MGPGHPLSAEDQDRYAEILSEILARVQGARAHLEAQPTRATVEYAALQLRMALERIVMGSLVANRTATEAITTALAKPSHLSAALFRGRLGSGG
jgi:hypothetical protein